jgi:hypothetical protein
MQNCTAVTVYRFLTVLCSLLMIKLACHSVKRWIGRNWEGGVVDNIRWVIFSFRVWFCFFWRNRSDQEAAYSECRSHAPSSPGASLTVQELLISRLNHDDEVLKPIKIECMSDTLVATKRCVSEVSATKHDAPATPPVICYTQPQPGRSPWSAHRSHCYRTSWQMEYSYSCRRWLNAADLIAGWVGCHRAHRNLVQLFIL